MKFTYKAKNKEGETKEGEMEAKSQLDLARQLRKDGFYILEAEEAGKSGGGFNLKNIAKFDLKVIIEKIRGVSLEEKMMFTRNLAVMVDSGIPISRSLDVLKRQTKSQTFKKIIDKINSDIRKGTGFSDAIEEHPKTFGVLYVSMVKAGEATGELEEVLNILADQLEKSHELRSRIRSALTYPAVIIVAMIGIGILMMVTVVPQLKSIFADLGVQLPITTRGIIFFSDIVRVYWWALLLSLPVIGFLLKKAADTKKGKRVFAWTLLHTPLFKGLTRKINNANFARTLSSLIAGGVPILQALDITSDTMSNVYYKESIKESGDKVKKGDNLFNVLKGYPDLYTPLVLEMLEVGEESGKLSELLQRVAEFYEEEVADATKNLSSIIEPVLMIVIGAIVGFFAISVMQPMYGMLGNL